MSYGDGEVGDYVINDISGLLGSIIEVEGNYVNVEWEDGRTYTAKDYTVVEECTCCNGVGFTPKAGT